MSARPDGRATRPWPTPTAALFSLPRPTAPSATPETGSLRHSPDDRPQSGGACPVCPHVTAHNTRPPWAQGHAGLARFGSYAAAWRRSRYGDGAARGGSTTPHPGTPRPTQGARTPARSSDLATFLSCVVRIRAGDPVFRPFPIGLQPLESPADRFVTHQARRDTLLIAHLCCQGQRPHPGRLAIEAWRLMQDMLEAFTCGGIQHGFNGLRTRRLLLQALHTTRVKSMDDITDGLDCTPHKLRNGLRGQSLGTREDDLGTPDTEGIRSAAVGLQLPMLIIGQGADKEWWFHSPSRSFDDYREVACLDTSPSVLLDGAMHKGSCGNALGNAHMLSCPGASPLFPGHSRPFPTTCSPPSRTPHARASET